MAEEQLSPYLEQVLEVFRTRIHGVMVDVTTGEPDPDVIARLADLLGDGEADVRNAILGLRQFDCLMEEEAHFEGTEGLVRWTVHPQCQGPEQPPRVVRRSKSL